MTTPLLGEESFAKNPKTKIHPPEDMQGTYPQEKHRRNVEGT